jgi:transcription antitermination factor NusG
LRLREKDGLIVLPETPYKVGQQVEFGPGPFDGIVGTILSMDEKQRLVILQKASAGDGLCGSVKGRMNQFSV